MGTLFLGSVVFRSDQHGQIIPMKRDWRQFWFCLHNFVCTCKTFCFSSCFGINVCNEEWHSLCGEDESKLFWSWILQCAIIRFSQWSCPELASLQAHDNFSKRPKWKCLGHNVKTVDPKSSNYLGPHQNCGPEGSFLGVGPIEILDHAPALELGI